MTGRRTLGLLGLALCLAWSRTQAQTPSSHVDIVFVGAHPDDESTAFATMAHYVLDEHCTAAVITATRGEGGGNATGREQGPALGILREAEERDALQHIGIHQVYYLDQSDTGFTTSAAAAESAWGHAALVARLVRYYRLLRPAVVITMNPWPVGHGHHQYIARLASEAFFQAGDSHIFPQQLTEEFLAPWQPKKLYYALEYGDGGLRPDFSFATGQVSPSQGTSYSTLKRTALRSYRTQGWDVSDDGIPSTAGDEPFVLARALPGASAAIMPQAVPTAADHPPDVTAELPPIPPLALFRTWAHGLGLDTLLHVVPSEVVLPQGASGLIPVDVVNHSPVTRRVDVGLTCAPLGLKAGPRSISLAAGQTRRVSFPLSIPASMETASLPLVTTPGDQTGVLEVVPTLRVPYGSETNFHRIPYDRLWDGKTADAADLSARFWVSYDASTLYVRVEVTDDVVVANIAPDDNKGHWRTDSVEIAIDPQRSETTLTTFKVGIIPFNTAGRAMAARDADARPGPIERTAPGMRISSQRTAHGYEVRAAIPRSLALGGATAFGFNVMVYDNDRRDARVGENAGHARIAWSAWPNVQGTPRLWGRATLVPR